MSETVFAFIMGAVAGGAVVGIVAFQKIIDATKRKIEVLTCLIEILQKVRLSRDAALMFSIVDIVQKATKEK